MASLPDTLRTILAGLSLLLAASAQSGNLYCCQDPGNGRRICGDGLPDACRGKTYKIFDGGGNLLREVGAPLTPEQKAQAAAEALRRKEEDAQQREQRRKDQALLDTYNSADDIDRLRERSEKEVQQAIREAEAKIANARKTRAKFEAEAEFYKKRALPPEVDKGLRDADTEIGAYTTLLESKKNEMQLIRAKYDEDKRRYIELSRRPGSAHAEPNSTAKR